MTDAHTETTEHLTCPWCRYDLFGLPTEGHIVRCPECGNRSDLRLLRIPPEDREKRIRGMESLPAIGAVSALFFVWFSLMATSELGTWRRLGGRIQWEFVGLASGCVITWTGTTWLFVRRYRFVRGATRMLALFHLCAPLLLFGFIFAISGADVAVNPMSVWNVGRLLLGLGMLGAGIWAYRRARGILRRMYEQLAGANDTRKNGNSLDAKEGWGLPTETPGNETSPQNGRPSHAATSWDRTRPPEP